MSWWPLDETGGTIADDIQGVNPGTLTGTTSVIGMVSTARRFYPIGTTGDSMVADGSGTLDITGNQVTIDAWIKLENNPTTDQVFTANVGKVTFPDNQPYLMTFESGSHLSLPQDTWRFEYILTNASGTRVHNQNTGVDVTVDGFWHHYTMTYDGVNVRLYVDGTLRGTFPFSGNLSG